MAKVSPVSIKYMVHASFVAEGALEKPDVIGAIFGQTEGLLGSELEMRELQKEGKIGRIEVELQRDGKKTVGKIQIPTALDQSETTLVAAAMETIERIGPTDAQIQVDRIEDVRGSKRDYIIERAKKLMQEIQGSTDSREISNQIKDHTRTSDISEYGPEKLPCGDLSGNEVIVVEGRADVLSLIRAGVRNVIAMNGTKLPDAIRGLSLEKEITLFVDGDRGGKLIARNVIDNARIKYVVTAPDGKEVEELTPKEVLMNLRKKVSVNDYLSGRGFPESNESAEASSDDKAKLKKISDSNKGSDKAVILNRKFEEIKSVSSRTVSGALRKLDEAPYAIVIDGIVTGSVIDAAEDAGIKIIVGSNFNATSERIQLLSL